MTEEIRNKARALRKYEADPLEILGVAPGGMGFLSPFGPRIGCRHVPEGLIQQLNQFADGHVHARRGSEFIVPPTIAETGRAGCLMDVIQGAIREFVMASERATTMNIVVDRIWIVSQYEGTPSPMHFHSGDLSGVLYLKTPPAPSSEELQKTYISGRQAGFINFIASGKQRFSRSLISFPPTAGTFYLFPAWLLHGAEPFRGPGERRSLSFNARVEIDES